MRSVLLAFMLCVSTTAAFARNGETGILISLPEFDLETSAKGRDLVKICDREWDMIQKLMKSGYEPEILLRGLGTFTLKKDPNGVIRLQDEGVEMILAKEDCLGETESDQPTCE